MNILGLHTFGHDTGAAVVTDRSGDLEIIAISEARLSRVKHASTYPILSIKYCLDAFDMSLSDLDHVYTDDLWERDRLQNSGLQFPSQIWERYKNDLKYFEEIRKFGRIFEQSVKFKPRFINHLDAHAASTYFLSPFDEAAILCADAGTGIYKGEGLDLKIIDRMGYTGDFYHNSDLIENSFATLHSSNTIPNTAYMYDAVTELLGYTPFECGKTMAIAAYGHQFKRHNIINFPKGRFLDFVIMHGATINRMQKEFYHFFNSKNRLPIISEQCVNLAREAQEALEEDMLHLVSLAQQKTHSSNLCLAGGTVLSCITNRVIYDKGIFDQMFIIPAASDEGIALGCALYGYYENGGQKRKVLTRPYLGNPNNVRRLPILLEQQGLNYRETNYTQIARLIAKGNIVGRMAGPSEFGPRALGNRSIIADPRDQNMKDKMNLKVKHRENFRPFAPSCHADKRGRYFDMPVEGPFMIIAAPVLNKAKNLIPAVTHVDGSSRPQTVRPDQNKEYYKLIEAFGELTDCYVLLNTSFNDSGEPIVETYYDCLISFTLTGIDYLFLEDKYLVSCDDNKSKLLDQLILLREKHIANAYRSAIATICDLEKYNIERKNNPIDKLPSKI